MSDEPKGGELVLQRVTQLATALPEAPAALVARIRQIRQEAFVLSPAVTMAAIPSHIKINSVVDVIETAFDPKTGRGEDVYFQASIHKSEKQGRGDFVPVEVSLNAKAIKRQLANAGVSITHSDEIKTGEQYHWKWQSKGKIRDFDGSWRELPPGTAEIDLRDGSAQIGEWTPEEWAKREASAEERKKALKADEQWKAKPQPIGGWTKDRVMSARRFGLRLAESKSLNALGRNIGLKQVYTIEELTKKPFVIFRATFNPNMSNPEIEKMVTAAELGATNLLGYPTTAAPTSAALPPAADAESAHVEGEVIHGDAPDPDDVPYEPTESVEPKKSSQPSFHITGVFRAAAGGFSLTTQETGATKHPFVDEAIAKQARDAQSVGVPAFLTFDGPKVIEIVLVDEKGQY